MSGCRRGFVIRGFGVALAMGRWVDLRVDAPESEGGGSWWWGGLGL